MYKCKITVLKRMANQDLIDEYMGDERKTNDVAPCPYCDDGQEYMVENPGVLPEGFCAWAWADINKEVLAITSGGNIAPWIRYPGIAITCCTDGFRPVVFKVERMENV